MTSWTSLPTEEAFITLRALGRVALTKELKTMVNDLKDQVTRMDREHEERMDRHREDIDWQREECILLRVGLQENEDRTSKLSVRQ